MDKKPTDVRNNGKKENWSNAIVDIITTQDPQKRVALLLNFAGF